MEEPRVGRRFRPLWIGLLIHKMYLAKTQRRGGWRLVIKSRVPTILFLILTVVLNPMGVFAQELEPVEEEPEAVEEELQPIELRVETNPDNPTVGNPWSVTILVNHPRPDEVNVETPDFPASLALERIRTDTRTISSGAGGPIERWTRVEFLFIPRRAETVRLASFEVRIGRRRALTDAMNVRVQGDTTARYDPRFRWVASPAGIRLGETAEITLELANWDPARRVPVDFFRGRAPVNAILEETSPERIDTGAYRYRIVLIPLDGPSVRLQAFSFFTETYTLNVPEINLAILPARQAALTPAESENSQNDIPSELFSENSAAALPFPQAREEVFSLLGNEYREIIAGVEALWEANRWAEALAEIRKNERDSLAGPSLVSLRREMETGLGFGVTEDERWRPFGVSLVSLAVVLVVLVFVGVFLVALHLYRRENMAMQQDRNVTFRKRYGFIVLIAGVFILGLVFVLPEGSEGIFPVANSARPGRIAVLKRTQSYRVPDYKGAVNDWFSEGQPVTVGDFSGDWCFVETLDGRSGWVERASVINY